MVSVPALAATPPVSVAETAPTERRDDRTVDRDDLGARAADAGIGESTEPAVQDDVAANANSGETSAAQQPSESAVGVAVAPAGSVPSDPQQGVKNELAATNQDSATESQQSGNDAKSQVEAHRALGQIVDLFA
ncbi:MAG: hypothetical protein MJE12_28545 [Alphaproteobacteria bacterium]|nr:hypothetical protein [Alphaproteobacteria bacterium]